MYKKLNPKLFNTSFVIPEIIKKLPLTKKVALLKKLNASEQIHIRRNLTFAPK